MKWLYALAFAGAFLFQAKAQEAKQGIVLLCDTPQQAETVVREYARTKDQEAAVDKANKEAGSELACTIQAAVYIIGSEVKRLSNEMGEVAIVNVIVVSWGKPTPQFSVTLIRRGSGA
jgi:hypothetical protein